MPSRFPAGLCFVAAALAILATRGELAGLHYAAAGLSLFAGLLLTRRDSRHDSPAI